jgi:hypothetical protein
MTLEQAYAVAQDVERDPRFNLVSIGKFVPLKEIASATRWGVAIHLIGAERPVVVFTPLDWKAFQERSKPSTEPMRDAKHRVQPTLF